MPDLTPVAILGFCAADRQDLAASLQRTARRSPAYTPVLAIDDARFVVADAEHPEVMALLAALGRAGDALLIAAPEDSSARFARNAVAIDPAWVLQRLDAMLAGGSAAVAQATTAHPVVMPGASTPASPGAWAEAPPALPASAAPPVPASNTPAPVATPGARRHSPWHQAHAEARQRSAAKLRAQDAPRVLLIDDSDIALHFLQRQLVPYGVEIDFARDSERAMTLLHQRQYGLVFLDLDLGEESRVGGLALCSQIRAVPRPCDAEPLSVVIVSAFHDPVHQVRGTLAGAAGFLGKPLEPSALARIMQRYGLSAATTTPPSPASASR